MDSLPQLVASHASIAASRPMARLFGEFQLVAADGGPVAISNSRARAILALLCTEPGQPIARETLSDLLWPGRFRAHARASLRQCLFELGKLLEPVGSDILLVTRSYVALNADALDTDLAALERALREGHTAAATRMIAAIGTEPLLDRIDFGDEFSAVVARRRQAAEHRLQTAVGQALAQLEAAGARKSQAALLSAWRLRDADFGMGGLAERPLAAARVAVLPFRSLGPNQSREYFSDGIAEELITALGRIADLQVAGRTSSFHFRGSELTLAEIASALRVTHLIEGSVLYAGETVRIHVHLIDGASGFELWGDRYDGTLDAIFALQETVAQAVTGAISAALGIVLQPPRIAGSTRSKEAYDLFLQGRSLCARRFGDGVLDSAVNLFERALGLDPDFAECWVALAEAHQLISVYTQCLDRNGETAKMAECARRAIAINPRLGYAHALLGLHELTCNNFAGALDHGFEGYRLDPDDPAVAMRLGSFLIFCGRIRDAAPYIKAAIDQDPVDGRKYALLWGVHLCQGDLDAALAAAQRMVDLGMMSIPLGVTLAALGQHELAIEKYRLSQRLMNDIILPPVGIGVQTPEAMDAYWLVAAKGMCGGREDYRQTYWQVLEMLFAVLHDKSDAAISGPAVMTGNPDLFYRTFGTRISASNLMGFVPLWADIDPMRRIWQHGEFIAFAQRIGLVAAWDKYGWPDRLPPPSSNLSAD